MKEAKANKIIQSLLSSVEKEGLNNIENLVSEMQALREFAKKENDPLVTRAIRMIYEHLENEDGWAMPVIGIDEEEEEAEALEENEEVEEQVEHSSEEHFSYVLNLLLRSENSYNRDELRKIANLLNEF